MRAIKSFFLIAICSIFIKLRLTILFIFKYLLKYFKRRQFKLQFIFIMQSQLQSHVQAEIKIAIRDIDAIDCAIVFYVATETIILCHSRNSNLKSSLHKLNELVQPKIYCTDGYSVIYSNMYTRKSNEILISVS